ncbi:hypothetical protein ACH4ZX_15585 [Streptomyces sp. NPDC020490]|uniref:hypothetical protein n=1 Tax=Streptomyces sp. NPDC020490 TaxID=3365078 RepID=UPI003788280C
MFGKVYVVAFRALHRADGGSFTCIYKIEDGTSAVAAVEMARALADTASERVARGGIDLDPVWCEVYGSGIDW